ncbi:hypothetical protein ABS71_20360 [bacterium SCN 62-11]|nr:MAG: hypothetical protein ABS71_20360 [bacterium SCN 62-11]
MGTYLRRELGLQDSESQGKLPLGVSNRREMAARHQVGLDEQSICENFGNGYTIKFNEFQSPFWCYDELGLAFSMEPREHRAVEVLLGSTDIELFSDSYPKRNLP